MLVKFDSKSNRVKGLSFHPRRPWILASLHNGVIQLWDYRMGVLLERFEEHEGPVRGISFHRSQPLFVSGGDDYKIKVWNYKLRRCLFTLLGHLDYIRTVEFHPEYPWIVSASDDQTIRIWNWQSRNCISVLTGHNHYVMCASFHPREDLIVSASLDQTVRVWDTAGLRRKTVRGAPSEDSGSSFSTRVNSDLFGANDAVVKYVLEGHDRGVNWASFHPTQNLIVSGADDRQVKLWRMNETKAWEMDTLRGHNNNVSCVMFHPKHDLLISNSEDRSIRVWDIPKRMCIQTFRRENDRFWILAVHPEQNLIAAGHDNGMMVFKLERERPAYGTLGNQLFYVRDRYLRRSIPGTGSDAPLVSLRLRGGAGAYGQVARQLLVNPHSPDEEHVLLVSIQDGGSYELYNLALSAEQEPGRGSCLAAVFTARAKFAVLDKTRSIILRSSASDPGKKLKPPYANADFLFPAATAGRVLVRAEDKICLFELQSRRVVAEISSILVKYVVWSADGSYVALIGKHSIVLADKELTQICSINETVRVKSGVWDENGVFIFTTLNHIKYLLPLPSADTGIVRTLDVPVYAVDCKENALWVLDRDAKLRSIPIDTTEHMFKLALARRQFDRVLNIIKTARLCGQAVIAYLQKAGYPEIALFFVEDEATKFNLALECGNLDVALRAAKALGSEDAWNRLAAEGLRQGNFEIVEIAYQTIKALDKLSFTYLIFGQQERLQKMLQIANMRSDVQSRFHNALYLGNVEERIKCLEAAGQIALAYATASTHGLEIEAARLKQCLEEAGLPVPEMAASASLLLPPTPIFRNNSNWPAAPISKGVLDPAAIAAVAAAAKESVAGSGNTDVAAAAVAAAVVAASVVPSSAVEKKSEKSLLHEDEDDAYYRTAGERRDGEAEAHGAGWGADDLDLGIEPAAPEAPATGGGWGDELDLDIDTTKGPGQHAQPGGLPAAGTSIPSYWVSNSNVAGDHVAAGSFETAMHLLNRQIGVVNFAPMKSYFSQVFLGTRAFVPTLPSFAAAPVYLQRFEGEATTRDKSLPSISLSLVYIQELQRSLYKAFTDGNFSSASTIADSIFASIPLVVVSSKNEVNDIKGILKSAAEYKMACRIVLTAKTVDQNDAARQIELAAYMTHCVLEPAHLMLAVNLAMGMAFKHKNFITAANFAKRLLEMPDINAAKNAQLLQRAKAVLQKSEAEARNAQKINYDGAFVLCAASLTPIYRGVEHSRSPYSGAAYQLEYKGSTCVIDGMAQVGVETLGLVCSASQSRK